MRLASQTVTSIAVFCGSNPGFRYEYADAARSLGIALATRKIRLICGGSSRGLMGILATAALDAGGEVVGIINQEFYQLGHLHPNLTSHQVVADMASRKRVMRDAADAFIALPGGLGTFEEILEVASLIQIGAQRKHIGVLNIEKYYTFLRASLLHAENEGFITNTHSEVVVFDEEIDSLLTRLTLPAPTPTPKWLNS